MGLRDRSMKLFVTVYEEEATSFGSVADSYDRARPGPPAEALDWLVPAGREAAVDLGAGSGLFTRALPGRAARRRRVRRWLLKARLSGPRETNGFVTVGPR
jgi:hypothetical protein